MTGVRALLRGLFVVWLILLVAASVVAAPRGLAVGQPLGGEVYEPGQPVVVSWILSGNWQAGDTVRIEYSSDAGASWLVVPGAGALACGLGSYTWDTTGCVDSAQYLVRVICNGRDTVSATSGQFELRTHTGAPLISHTPLSNTPHFAGPFRVRADVSDDRGLGSVKLHYCINGGAMTELSMTQDGGSYYADIPGPIFPEALVQYYIDAVDASYNHNAARFPSDPVVMVGFWVNAAYTDSIGSHDYFDTVSGGGRGNVFLCTQGAVLTRMSQGISSSIEPFDLTFFVYESLTRDGVYRKLAESTHPAVTLGQIQDSGNLDVLLVPGRYYMIGATSRNSAAFYHAASPGSATTLFGDWVSGYSSATYPPPLITTSAESSYVYAQDITTVRVSRALAMTQNTDGKWLEPGQMVDISLSAVGFSWQAGDTIRLEYSSDSGATWTPIAGAENLPYDTATYVWHTTGYAESDHYRLRVVCNADVAVYDASDADFKLRLDTTAPVIVHKPLVDACPPGANYIITATVTDDKRVGSVTYYVRRNDGAFYARTMTSSTTPGVYSGLISGRGVLGDHFDYYIEARDVSFASHVTRSPESGYHTFSLIDPLAENFSDYISNRIFDLAYTALMYTPDGSTSFYSLHTRPIAALPTDPAGGNVISIAPGMSTLVVLPAGRQVWLYGTPWDRFYVGANGSIVFGAADGGGKASYLEHYRLKRISGLLSYLDLSTATVSWAAGCDRVAVTYQNATLPLVRTSVQVTFQIEMFYDGRIQISYLGVNTAEPIAALVGLSNGFAPAGFVPSNLSSYTAGGVGRVTVTDSIGVMGDHKADLGILTSTSPRTARVTLYNKGPEAVICDSVRLGYYCEDFNDNAAQGWRLFGLAQASITAGEYTLTGNPSSQELAAVYSREKYGDFYLEAFAKNNAGCCGPLLLRGGTGAGSYSDSLLTGYAFYAQQGKGCILSRARDYIGAVWSGPPPAMPGQWNRLAVDAKGSQLGLYVNGVLAGTVTNTLFSSGYIGLGAFYGGSVFDNVFVGPPLGTSERATGFRLTGVPALPVAIGPYESREIDVTYDPLTPGTAAGAALQFVMRGADVSSIAVRLSAADLSASNVPEFKAVSDGGSAALQAKRVSAVFADRFYVEEFERNSGICVLWDGPMPALGSQVTAYGKLVTVDGERAVRAESVRW